MSGYSTLCTIHIRIYCADKQEDHGLAHENTGDERAI